MTIIARAKTSERCVTEWEQLGKLFCPNCGARGLWVLRERAGTYPAICTRCSESCVINPGWDCPDGALEQLRAIPT